MAPGKTTLARALAQELHFSVVSVDSFRHENADSRELASAIDFSALLQHLEQLREAGESIIVEGFVILLGPPTLTRMFNRILFLEADFELCMNRRVARKQRELRVSWRNSVIAFEMTSGEHLNPSILSS